MNIEGFYEKSLLSIGTRNAEPLTVLLRQYAHRQHDLHRVLTLFSCIPSYLEQDNPAIIELK